MQGFNPCCRGCCSWPVRGVRTRGAVGFQSLFSWMLLSGLAVTGRSSTASGFNPCSRGCCSVARPMALMSEMVEVSILVLVDVAHWPAIARRRRLATVSILVLVDVAQWLGHVSSAARHPSSFNPCSRGCCSVARRGTRLWPNVSILVLVDVAQWPPPGLGARRPPGFNPCSRGCCSVARSFDGLGEANVGFNPCSRGCCSVAVPGTPRWSRLIRFQSLFSWMLLSGRLPGPEPAIGASCFNPCSRGCCSVASTRPSGCAGEAGFQSLFSWMLLTGTWPCRLTCRWRGFQSLFSWMLLTGRVVTRDAVGCTRFQSLFSWMLLSGVAASPPCMWSSATSFNPCSRGCCSVARVRRPRRDIRRFQSLFSWMLLTGRPPAGLRGTAGFNPCSRGCCSVAATWQRRAVPTWVSILVLVDVAQWPRQSAAVDDATACFNPCSRGCCSVARGRRCTTLGRSFNPCSRGCCSVAADAARRGSAVTGFNPCSRGCCSVACQRWPRLATSRGVSILVLVDVAQWRRTAAELAERPRVSILVLVDVAQWHEPSGRDAGPAFEFQSLFSWMLLSGRRHRVAVGPAEVSILVLVDVAQWPTPRPARADAGDVSILVVVDVAQWPCASQRSAHTGRRVSILVLVDVAQWLPDAVRPRTST